MTRIAIAGFQHETNTFAPFPTTLDLFQRGGSWPPIARGEDILARFRDLNIPISGFIGASAHEMVPILWAAAEPGGYVDGDAFETIVGEIVAGIEAARPDAVYLDLHGAMATRAYPDAEAEILRRVRAVIGEDLPLVASVDLHGNLSPEFFERASAVAMYRTYPHTDMGQTGARAAALVDALLEGPLCKAWQHLDFLIPITAQSTRFSPARDLYADVANSAARSADMCLGFPPADIPYCGPVVAAYDPDQAVADAAVRAIVERVYQAEPDFDSRLTPARDAVTRALSAKRGPVVIADPQDNPGAGGTGDTTGILQALIAAQAPDAVVSMLHDPESAAAAHAAGLGAEITISLGGGFAEFSPPLEVAVLVEALSDGRFQFTGPYLGGAQADLGPVARLRLSGTGITVVVGSRRAQNADQEMFRVVGIEPSEHAIVCVKSAVHFMADYQTIAADILFAEAPGANPCNLELIPYSALRPGVRLGPGGPLRP